MYPEKDKCVIRSYSGLCGLSVQVNQYSVESSGRRQYSTNHVYLHRFSRLRFCVCV